MRYLKPFPTLAVGVLLGALVWPKVRMKVQG